MVGLLAEHGEADAALEHDVVPLGGRRPEAVDAARLEEPARDDLVQELVRVRVELARRRPDGGVVEDLREAPLQLPGVEEERPVDVLAQEREVGLDDPRPGEGGRRQVLRAPLDRRPVRARPLEREERLALLLAVELAQSCSCAARFSWSRRSRRSGSSRSETTPTTREASRTCSVGLAVGGRDLHRGVLA